jgi:hypothetical protein
MKSRAIVIYGWGLLILMSLLLPSCDTSGSEGQSAYFIKYYGLEGNQEGVDMIVNDDGTFYLFGNSKLPGKNQQLYLLKADANGMMLWDEPKFFGGDVYANYARDIEKTSDGKLVMVATSERAVGDNDVLLIIADQEGNELNSVKRGYAGTNEDASTVTQISDGFIVTGSTTNVAVKPNPVANDQLDIFTFRYNTDLTTYAQVWNDAFGAGIHDAGVKTVQVNANLFYVFSYTDLKPPLQTTANYNFAVYPLNNFGVPVGATSYAGTSSVNERLTSVLTVPASLGGGFFLTGIATEVSGENRVYIAKMNKDLTLSGTDADFVYQKSFSSSLGALATLHATSAASVTSGFFVLSNENSSGNQNFCLSKSTNEGEEIWKDPSRFIFGGAGADKIGAVAELPDGKIVMLGTFSIGDDAQEKMALIKVNKDGKFSD